MLEGICTETVLFLCLWWECYVNREFNVLPSSRWENQPTNKGRGCSSKANYGNKEGRRKFFLPPPKVGKLELNQAGNRERINTSP